MSSIINSSLVSGSLPQTNPADRVKLIQSKNLMVMASNWASRPPDECFWGVDDCLDAARLQESCYTVETVNSTGARIEAGEAGKSGRLYFVHPDLDGPRLLNNYSTGQLCKAIGAPQNFLSTLAPTTAAAVLTERLTGEPTALAAMVGQTVAKGRLQAARVVSDNRIVLHGARSANGKGLVRCFSSLSYTPFSVAAILQRLQGLPKGWRTPPGRPSPTLRNDPRIRPATEQDVIDWNNQSLGGNPIQLGDLVGPSGAYLSDRDFAILLVNPEYQITASDQQALTPFVLLSQGTVAGFKAWSAQGGFLDGVCGNLIMWGTRVLFDLSVRHIGNNDAKVFAALDNGLAQGIMALPPASKLQADIQAAKNLSLGHTDDEVVETVRKVTAKAKIVGIGQKDTREAIRLAALADRYGSPHSAWGVVQGLTELSQKKALGYQNVRQDMDSAAGALLDTLLN